MRVTAEMQTPSGTIPLEMSPKADDAMESGLSAGASLQHIVRFDLMEEGNHVLAVSLSYSETKMSETGQSATQGRARSFRKLYQFIAQPCLSVRTKASDLPSFNTVDDRESTRDLSRFALEAQLENMADGPILLEELSFHAKPAFASKSLNWDAPESNDVVPELPSLTPRETTQVAFLIEEQEVNGSDGEPRAKELTPDGRTILGQLTIHWRSAMGNPGLLSTGWLSSRKK
ncbi:hypothetical protein MMC09_002111 [Bachmanniomyces sp. S44760]|nr:hypothetical protein [Bachmanniomyces sp. S44760]